jgi:TRAP-type mannitol/chloroaromatic compound transport system permease large subunit
MLVVMLVMFVLGFVLDFIEITFVVVPIVGPVLLAMGLNPVWLGVMIAINLQTSFLTPPFGFSLFYLRGVAPAEVDTRDIYRGVAPFVAIQLLALAVLAAWPGLATWLPDYLY